MYKICQDDKYTLVELYDNLCVAWKIFDVESLFYFISLTEEKQGYPPTINDLVAWSRINNYELINEETITYRLPPAIALQILPNSIKTGKV